MAWADQADTKGFMNYIKAGSLDINEIVKGIVEKFTNVGTDKKGEISKNPRFTSAVFMAAKADTKTHTVVKSALM